MLYIQCVSYGQTLAHAKALAKVSSSTILARRAARGIYNIYSLTSRPVQSGQANFQVDERTDRVLNVA